MAFEFSEKGHLRFDSKMPFPVKLYEVANDSCLIKWNEDGTSILVDEVEFEDKVMTCYPGFVQIPTFLNFRRLFREYSFRWRIVDGTETLFEFTHSSFVRGNFELLRGVKTRRRSFHKPGSRYNRRDMRQSSSTSPGKLRRRYRRRRHVNKADCHSGQQHGWGDSEHGDQYLCVRSTPSRSLSDFSQTCSAISEDDSSGGRSSCLNLACESCQTRRAKVRQLDSDSHLMVNTDDHVTQDDLSTVLAVYAMNELTDDEYLQLIANKASDSGSISTFHEHCHLRETTIDLSQEPSPTTSEEFVPLDNTSHRYDSWGFSHTSLDEDCDAKTASTLLSTEDKARGMDGSVWDLDRFQGVIGGLTEDDPWYTSALDVTNLTPTLTFLTPLAGDGADDKEHFFNI